MQHLRHPEGPFKDKKKWILVEQTGEMRAWPYKKDPRLFGLNKEGKLVHNRPNGTTYAERTCHAAPAVEFLECQELPQEKERPQPRTKGRDDKVSGHRQSGTALNEALKVRDSICRNEYDTKKRQRTKKRKSAHDRRNPGINRKYWKDLRRAKKRRREKVIRKARSAHTRSALTPGGASADCPIETCTHCLRTSRQANIIQDPFQYRACGGCGQLYGRQCVKGIMLCDLCIRPLPGFCPSCTPWCCCDYIECISCRRIRRL